LQLALLLSLYWMCCSKRTLLSDLYKPPTANHSNFVEHLDVLLHNLATTNHKSFIFSDSNINLLKITNNQSIRDYLETVHSNVFLQIISKATRISGHSYSLKDHILWNHFSPTFKTGTLVVDISDHLMNFISVPSSNKITNKNPRSLQKHARTFSLRKLTDFKTSLSRITWANIMAIHDVDASFDIFWDTFYTFF
jgi:hypothetical protein